MTVNRVTQAAVEVLGAPPGGSLRVSQAAIEVIGVSLVSMRVSQAAIEAAGYWVGPKPPMLTVSNITATSADLAGDAFDQWTGGSATHSATRWVVYRMPDHEIVYDTGYISDLTSHSIPVDSLPSNTFLYAQASYRNALSEDSYLGPTSPFTTLAETAQAAIRLAFLNGSDVEVGEYIATEGGGTASYQEFYEEGIVVPTGAVKIRPYSYKLGSETKNTRTRQVQVDKGIMAAGYHPPAFHLGIDDESLIDAAFNDYGNQSSAVTVDFSLYRVAQITLTGDVNLTFSGMEAGRRYYIILKQDATGSRLVSWGSGVKHPGGTAPTLTTTASAVDIFEAVAESGSVLHIRTFALDSK